MTLGACAVVADVTLTVNAGLAGVGEGLFFSSFARAAKAVRHSAPIAMPIAGFMIRLCTFEIKFSF